MTDLIKCDECGNYFKVGKTEDGFPNGIGFELADGTIHKVCHECITKMGMLKTRNEVEMFAIHILSSEFEKAFNPEIPKAIIKLNGAITTQSKNPLKYISSVIFRSKNDRKKFAKLLDKLNIKYEIEKKPCMVDKDYL